MSLRFLGTAVRPGASDGAFKLAALFTTCRHSTRRLLEFAFAVALAMQFASPARATTIAWGVPTESAGESNSSLTGSLVGSFSLADMYGNVKNLDGKSADEVQFISTERTDTGPSRSILTISDLTIGTSYQFQWAVRDVSGDAGATSASSALAGNLALLEHGLGGSDGLLILNVGEYVTGRFIADATTQEIIFESAADDGSDVASLQLNALRCCPNPSSTPEPTGLIPAIGLAVFGSRRRHRRIGSRTH